MRKVADWQIATAEPRFSQQWTFAALYDGLFAASQATGDARYAAAVERAATRFEWRMIDTRFPHADDEAIGRAYLTFIALILKPSEFRARVRYSIVSSSDRMNPVSRFGGVVRCTVHGAFGTRPNVRHYR